MLIEGNFYVEEINLHSLYSGGQKQYCLLVIVCDKRNNALLAIQCIVVSSTTFLHFINKSLKLDVTELHEIYKA